MDSETIIRVTEKFIQYPWGVSMMARVTGLPKPTIERIYRTLSSWGVIEFCDSGLHLTVGPLIALGIVQRQLAGE